MRMRKKKNLIPRMERCAPCRVQDGFALRGRWREALMPSARELRLELGCGKGRFTAETARTRTSCSSPLRRCRTRWWWPWSGPWTWS